MKALLNSILGFLHELGGLALFSASVSKTFFTTRGNFRPIMGQVAFVSIRSLSTVAFSGIFVGAILVLQFSQILANYDALSFLGGLNTSAVIREIGPLIISFLLAGKIGAFTAAELGTMRVTEQIDAIQCLGTDPIQYIVIPRFIGIVVSSIILLGIALIVSVAGSMAVASVVSGINFLEFASSIPRFTTLSTFTGGLFKAFVFGSIVAAVSCYKGYTASGGARGVGRAVTQAAVYTGLYIVLADFLVTNFLDGINQLVALHTGSPGG